MALLVWNHAFYDKGVNKSCTFVILVSLYTNNKRITYVSEFSSIIYCMSLYVLLLISITMNEVFNIWKVHHLLRSPRDTSSAYCWPTFVCDVDPGWHRPSAKCAGILAKSYCPSPSCWVSAWCYPRGSWRGCSRGILQAIPYAQCHFPPETDRRLEYDEVLHCRS